MAATDPDVTLTTRRPKHCFSSEKISLQHFRDSRLAWLLTSARVYQYRPSHPTHHRWKAATRREEIDSRVVVVCFVSPTSKFGASEATKQNKAPTCGFHTHLSSSALVHSAGGRRRGGQTPLPSTRRRSTEKKESRSEDKVRNILLFCAAPARLPSFL